MTRRLKGRQHLTVLGAQSVRWSNKIDLAPERLDQPIRWKRPRLIFVNSLSDVFHKDVPFEYVAAMFGVMLIAEQHTFQILTKRADRMVEFYKWLGPMDTIQPAIRALSMASKYGIKIPNDIRMAPFPNVWMGVSVEDQKRADERIPLLRQVPAAVRWLSCEPLLGKVDLDLDGIHWVVVGGESGPGARPMDAEWVRAIRDECVADDVPFFCKQWGQYDENGVKHTSKKDAGCEIDGVDWKQYPATP